MTYQWVSAAAFCGVASPSQAVGGPPLGQRATQGLVGTLEARPGVGLRGGFQQADWGGAGPLWNPSGGGLHLG